MRTLEYVGKKKTQNFVRKPIKCSCEENSFIKEISLNVYYVFC